MTTEAKTIAGDQTRVSVLVAVEPAEAFRVFTEEIDQWWRRGPKYRAIGGARGVLFLEPRVGGRLIESIDREGVSTVVETGQVTEWAPPSRFVLSWRASNFAPDEKTEVEVVFAPSPSGTLVTVTHRGWAKIRADHPVRHGADVSSFIRRMALWWGDLASAFREYNSKNSNKVVADDAAPSRGKP